MSSKQSVVKDISQSTTSNSTPSESDGTGTEPSTNAEQENKFLGSTKEHVFSDPSVADYWREKYEKAGYENRHRFDPEFQWGADEEKRLVRKVCVHVSQGLI